MVYYYSRLTDHFCVRHGLFWQHLFSYNHETREIIYKIVHGFTGMKYISTIVEKGSLERFTPSRWSLLDMSLLLGITNSTNGYIGNKGIFTEYYLYSLIRIQQCCKEMPFKNVFKILISFLGNPAPPSHFKQMTRSFLFSWVYILTPILV